MASPDQGEGDDRSGSVSSELGPVNLVQDKVFCVDRCSHLPREHVSCSQWIRPYCCPAGSILSRLVTSREITPTRKQDDGLPSLRADPVVHLRPVAGTTPPAPKCAIPRKIHAVRLAITSIADRLGGNTGVREVWRSGVSYSMTDNRSRGRLSACGVRLVDHARPLVQPKARRNK
jgi:hypothetical protein